MWKIATTDNFTAWFAEQDDGDRAAILAAMLVLEKRGPGLPRPYADTVKGSRYTNMKDSYTEQGTTDTGIFCIRP